MSSFFGGGKAFTLNNPTTNVTNNNYSNSSGLGFSLYNNNSSSNNNTINNNNNGNPVQSNTLQVLRANREIIQLDLTSCSLKFSSVDQPAAINFTYQLKYWPKDVKAKLLTINEVGSLLAVAGEDNVTLLVIKLPTGKVGKIEEIEVLLSSTSRKHCSFTGTISWIGWHPLSPADHHLCVLSSKGSLAMFDLSQANFSIEEELASLDGPEQVIQVISSGSWNDGCVAVEFGAQGLVKNRGDLINSGNPWIWVTAFVLRESGDVNYLCPMTPKSFKIRKNAALLPMKQSILEALEISEEEEGQRAQLQLQLTWIEGALSCSRFLPEISGITDWIVVNETSSNRSEDSSFTHLIPRPQGPFLVQPEPQEIRNLDTFERAVAFKYSNFKGFVDLLIIAFASGKVDFTVIVDALSPKWILAEERVKPVPIEDLPVLALIESVDLRASSTSGSKRSTFNSKVSILMEGAERSVFLPLPIFFLASDASITAVWITGLTEVFDNNREEEEEEEDRDSLSVQCHAELLQKGQMQETLMLPGEKEIKFIVNNRVACCFEVQEWIRRARNAEITALSRWNPTSESNTNNNNNNNLLKAVQHAFPLHQLKTDSGSMQLESEVEVLRRTIARLKESGRKTELSKEPLPEGIDEVSASAMNDSIEQWQSGVVAPSLRLSKELELRSGALIKNLRMEREALVRARTLLGAKPDRLRGLLDDMHRAHEKQLQLEQRTARITSRLQELSRGREGLSAALPAQLHLTTETLQAAHLQLSQIRKSWESLLPKKVPSHDTSSNVVDIDGMIVDRLMEQKALLERIQDQVDALKLETVADK